MDETVYWFALATVLLFFKMFATSAYQGYHRIGKKTFSVPEDAAFAGQEPANEELPQVRRAAKAWLNDLENIPIFLGLGIVYILVSGPPASAPWLFMGFTIARYLHTLFYLAGVQPWRTIAFTVGLVCLFTMSIQILMAIF